MVRTILVTTVTSSQTNKTSEIYGRFDVVALNNRGYKIINQEKRLYEMSDSDFVKYGKQKI